jgi:hypothetical protein
LKLKNDIGLTKDGERIFSAVRPELLDADAFNEKCETKDANYSTLGCYSGNHVYVYDIDNRELDGIRQTTLAHELLHAIWARTPRAERERLQPSLKKLYDANDSFKEHLKSYSEDEFYDELHSIVGTETKLEDMPDDLKEHYARYLSNQSDIVEQYEKYIGVFKQYKDRLKELEKEVNEYKTKLSTQRENYIQKTQTYNEKIEYYQSHKGENAYSSWEEAEKDYNEILKLQAELKEDYQQYVKAVGEYNDLVNEYNSNVVHTKELQKSTNSLSK